jgi:hypothetical protein
MRTKDQWMKGPDRTWYMVCAEGLDGPHSIGATTHIDEAIGVARTHWQKTGEKVWAYNSRLHNTVAGSRIERRGVQ